MPLVTVQRSPSVGSSPPSSESGTTGTLDDDDGTRSKSLSECYFAGKGAALVLPPNERVRPSRRVSSSGCDIQQHLQSMFYLLRPEETLKMAVKLESVHPGRTRYLVVVSCIGRQDAEECCLLGIDCNEKTTVGLVLRVLADTTITLDGDGGFSVCVCGRQHIFKPVSVQAMWSALQTLHKVSSKAREQNYFQGGLTHDWVGYYEQRIESDRSCLNEWHAMDNIESRRPPSPDSVRTKPCERDETECVIRCKLKEIMMSVDLDEVTSKYIRSRLEEDLDMDLGEYKSFLDQEMLTILGQMDAATEIFDHVYLGSEWNASNHEELQKNGVGHILNVTREIDNFFPGMFNYLNIRVYDDEKTDLLKHWDKTFKYITRARADGSKVLVHCKMGVSRSASVVIAYAMKAFSWDFRTAFEYVKQKRTCIKPNQNFMQQLETYQGILDAMKNKEKLQRSKSETNLKCSSSVGKQQDGGADHQTDCNLLDTKWSLQLSGAELSKSGGRPKSWSPDNTSASLLFAGNDVAGPTSVSMEHLAGDFQICPACRGKTTLEEPCKNCFSTSSHNVRLPCGNGQIYSVSPNKIVYLPGSNNDVYIASVKHRVNEFESQTNNKPPRTKCEPPPSDVIQPPVVNVPIKKTVTDRKGLVLNLTSQFESSSKSTSPTSADVDNPIENCEVNISSPTLLTAVLVKEEEWDPGDKSKEEQTTPPVRKRVESDPFSNKLDRVFEREERKQHRTTAVVSPQYVVAPIEPTTEVAHTARESPSRQSSWSSYDSAVVLGDAPSRQSSWGSGDLRGPTLPSRNSSWGSYDMRQPMQYVNERGEQDNSNSGLFPYDKEDIPWYPGTVKRTKQKLEGSSEDGETSPKTEISICNLKLHGPRPYQAPVHSQSLSKDLKCEPTVLVHYASSPTLSPHGESECKTFLSHSNETPLSASAPDSYSMALDSPCVIKTTQCSSVLQQKKVLENLTCLPKRCVSVDESETDKKVQGKVKNLKMEFEKKSESRKSSSSPTNSVRSLPSDSPPSESPPPSTEDLTVRILVGKYEKPENEVRTKNVQPPIPPSRKSSLEVNSQQQIRIKHSSLFLHNLKNTTSPNVVVASVVAKAASKKQQGKTHPLAHLTIKPRHNNPVYNTM